MVVVVMVPALVTAPAVGIFNNDDDEVEIPAAVDKAAVVPEVRHEGISAPQ